MFVEFWLLVRKVRDECLRTLLTCAFVWATVITLGFTFLGVR